MLLGDIGGLTISGGEPMLQPKAIRELAARCHRDGVNVFVETAGTSPPSCYAALLDCVDGWLFGLRPCTAPACTPDSVGLLDVVIENLRRLSRSTARVIIRTPLIPGFTTGRDGLAIVTQMMLQNKLHELQLLPPNPNVNHYYVACGLPPPFGGAAPALASAEVERIVDEFTARGIQPEVVA